MNSLSALHKKLELLQKRTRSIIALHEINRIFWQTDILSNQIPESYASGAYIMMRQALIHHEVILLNSLFEGGENNYGILSILKGGAKVAEEIKDDVFRRRTVIYESLSKDVDQYSDSFCGNFTEDEKKNIATNWIDSDIDDAINDAEKSVKYLHKLNNCLENKNKHKQYSREESALKHLRTKIAHAAEKTNIEIQLLEKNEDLEKVLGLRFEDIETFLNKNRKIINEISYYLKLEINSLDTQDIARQRAEELLMNCKFDIPKSL